MNAARKAGSEAGALADSVRIAFRFLALLVLVLGAVWLASGIRQIDPESRAVVLRFGRIDRERDAGLVFALPAPLEEVVIVPSPQRILTVAVDALDLLPEIRENTFRAAAAGLDPRRDGGHALTGDLGAVHLRAQISYRVSEAGAYLLAKPGLDAALRRLFVATAIRSCAGRTLDGVLVARPDQADTEPERARLDEADRQVLRADLVRGMQARLVELERQNTGLGIAIERVDITAILPGRVQPAFEQVLSASQSAEREQADARTSAERRMQSANQEREALLSKAQASAREVLAQARLRTDKVFALAGESSVEERKLLLERMYRERIETLLARAGSVIAVPYDKARVAVPGDVK